ncbi:MAG: nucleotidyltransferase domain-containing protein [Phycisphaerae bacterium]|nr:nucleotidyltransferase domain-containing protein [Phycisphaerae bacterium]
MDVHIPIRPEQIQEFCRKWKLVEFSLFGSVLRDDFRPESDVDVLIDFEEGHPPSFSDICDMEDELTSMFQRDVDLVIRRSIEQSDNYIRRRNILSSLEPIHVAG